MGRSRRSHPHLAENYRKRIVGLAESLNDESCRLETAELLRGLVSEVQLHPDVNADDGHGPTVLRAGRRFRWLRERDLGVGARWKSCDGDESDNLTESRYLIFLFCQIRSDRRYLRI